MSPKSPEHSQKVDVQKQQNKPDAGFAKVQPEERGATTPKPENTKPQSLPTYTNDDNKDTFSLGQRVIVHGYQPGVIMYIGQIHIESTNEAVHFGIKLDQPQGSGDGSISGVRYFECDPDHSVFVSPDAVKPWPINQ